MNVMLWFESLLEESLMYLLDFDPDVKRFKEQPFPIWYICDGRKRRYTPDLFVERATERQIIEVKPKRKVETEKYNLLFRIISPICEKEGFRFKVFTEESILWQPRLNSIKALWSYARTPLCAQHQIYCQELLQKRSVVSLAEAFEFFKAKGVPKQVVYALLFWGALDFNLAEPLNPNSRIYLPSSTEIHARRIA
jgi:hypothetical protein